MPHVIEPSIGVDRLMLAVLTSAYCTDEVGGEKRTLLKFHPRLAPIKVASYPCTNALRAASPRTTHGLAAASAACEAWARTHGLATHCLALALTPTLTLTLTLTRWPSSRCSRTSPSWWPRRRRCTPSCSGATTWPTTPRAPSAGSK